MGYKFTPQKDGQITKLCGYYSGTKRVRLFDASYGVLASVNVLSNGEDWSCSDITPVNVSNGSIYYVVADIASSGGCYRSGAGLPKTCGDILINTSVYQPPSGTFNLYHNETAATMYGMADVVFSIGFSSVQTDDATNIQKYQAILNGNLTDIGEDTSATVWLEWGIDASYGNTTAPQNKTSIGSFSSAINALSLGTVYHFRAVAQNSSGTVYGDDKSFTTLANPASIQTNIATDIKAIEASLNGDLTDLGGANSCNVWFEYGLTASYGSETTHNIKSSTGVFNDSIIGLSPATAYYFRAVAENTAGIVYGSDKSFSTNTNIECYPNGQNYYFTSDNTFAMETGRIDADNFLIGYTSAASGRVVRVARVEESQTCFGPEFPILTGSGNDISSISGINGNRAFVGTYEGKAFILDTNGYDISVERTIDDAGGYVSDSVFLDSNKILIGYTYRLIGSNFSYLRTRIIDISGSTILGPELTLSTDANGFYLYYDRVSLDMFDQNKAIVAYEYLGSAYLSLLTISGNNISITNTSPGPEFIRHFDITVVDPNNYFFVYIVDGLQGGTWTGSVAGDLVNKGETQSFVTNLVGVVNPLNASRVDESGALFVYIDPLADIPIISANINLSDSSVYLQYTGNPGAGEEGANSIRIEAIDRDNYLFLGSIRPDLSSADYYGMVRVGNIAWSPFPPTVTNSIGASNIITDSARLNGEITSTGGEDPSVKMYWGDNDGGETPASWDNMIDLGIKPIGTFFNDISGLNPDIDYYYRSYASNSVGDDWANSTALFTTSALPPGACQDHNVWGWAWAGAPQSSGGEKLGMGWLSFSCKNLDSGTNYGVDIEADGNLTGYAYYDGMNDSNTAEHEAGWIDFDPTVPDLQGSSDYSARVSDTGELSGWARAVEYGGGWDGWIKMRKDPLDGGQDYGVYIDTGTGEFHGWAWGDDVMGWISFNCDNSESPNSCASTNNYHVETSFSFSGNPPQVTNFKKTADPLYCLNSPTQGLEWNYIGDTPQQAYKIEFRDKDTGIVLKIVEKISSSDTSGVEITTSPNINELEIDYNESYQFKIKVQDEDNAWSSWSNVVNFDSTFHLWPNVIFDLIPSEGLSVDEIASTTNSSVCFDNNNNEISCSSWLWTFPDGDGTFAGGTTATDKEPLIQFSSNGDKSVKLRASDGSFTCELEKGFTINYPMPGWIEE